MLHLLGEARYVQLTTFRRDGRGVPTPVWVVREGDELLAFTGAHSGKVKRLRRDDHVLLVPCSALGRPLGRPVDARARLLPASEGPRVEAAVRGKYGRQVTGALLVEHLSQRMRKQTDRRRLRDVPAAVQERAYLAVRLEPSAGGTAG